MDAKSCGKLVVLTLFVVATISSLGASAAEVESFKQDRCKVECLLECAAVHNTRACYLTCFKNCVGNVAVATLGSQCDLGCILSKCFHSHPDAKNAEGCVNSCSEDCNKF